MKKEMKQVLWVVALFVILMTATGNLVSAAGFDWSDDTFGNACKKVYSVSFRSGGGASSAIYKKLEKKQIWFHDHDSQIAAGPSRISGRRMVSEKRRSGGRI